MKFATPKILLLLSMLLVAAYDVRGQSIVNPGFETGTKSGWTLEFDDQSPERWQIVTSPVQAGNYALLADSWPKALSQSFSSIAAAGITEFSFWTSVTVDSRSHLQLIYLEGTENVYFDNIAGGFSKKDATSNLNTAMTLTGFRLYTWNPSNPSAVDTYYDSFTLTTVPEPSTWVLIVIGLALSVAHRVRHGLRS
jgi:hypothetical protein